MFRRNLELHAVSEVMTRDVKIIRSVETVKTIGTSSIYFMPCHLTWHRLYAMQLNWTWRPSNWTDWKLNYYFRIDTWVFQLLMIKAFVALSIELIWLIYCSIQKYLEKELIRRLMSLSNIIVFIQIMTGFIYSKCTPICSTILYGPYYMVHILWAICFCRAY